MSCGHRDECFVSFMYCCSMTGGNDRNLWVMYNVHVVVSKLQPSLGTFVQSPACAIPSQLMPDSSTHRICDMSSKLRRNFVFNSSVNYILS